MIFSVFILVLIIYTGAITFNNIKYYTEQIGESSINGSRIEIVYLKDYTNDLENLKEKINNYIKNKEL